MPTRLPRHAITETPDVAAALDLYRSVTGEKVNLAELVILGARTKAESVRAGRTEVAAALNDLADMVASGGLSVDPDVADQARRIWTHRD